MKEKLKLIGFILLIPIIGGLSSLFFEPTNFYLELNKPLLAPPGWLFGIAWTILYGLLGATLYYIIKSKNYKMLAVYALQIIINLAWSYIFFNFELFIPAFIMIVIMFILTLIMMINYKGQQIFYLLLPYILWLTFAGYLNLSIIVLN